MPSKLSDQKLKIVAAAHGGIDSTVAAAHGGINSTVAAAVSGGVDSAVAAALLKEQGHNVTAVFMDCLQGSASCPADEDRRAAREVAEQLGLPFKVFNLGPVYRQRILNYFYSEYRQGRTPNPDVKCNQEIKFGTFLEKALKELKVDAIATGHYVRRKFENGFFQLYRGVDKSKDQSYFLYRLSQNQLAKALFPLGEMTKRKVREKAHKMGLLNWERPDSQGLCFLGETALFEFLRRRLPEKTGPVVNQKSEVIGEHRGVWFYTIGQRHGFSITRYQGRPLYIISKDMKKNELLVGPRAAVCRDNFTVTDHSWLTGRPFQGKCLVRIRHLGELIPGEISLADNLTIQLSRPVFAVAPGQSAVFYQGEKMLGGGVIELV